MKGKDLIRSLSRKLAQKGPRKPLARNALAKLLGMSGQALANWLRRSKDINPAQIANHVAKAMQHAHESAEREAIKPIVEFFALQPADSKQKKRKEIFSPADAAAHPYLSGLREELRAKRGIYVFYDSRGRALYAGKALEQSLWTEIKSALNRDRDLQQVRRVKHPRTRTVFRTNDEKQRQIVSESLALYSLAKYVSAYSVPRGLIHTLEALLIRGFANDLLNARMERFAKPHAKRKSKRRARRKS